MVAALIYCRAGGTSLLYVVVLLYRRRRRGTSLLTAVVQLYLDEPSRAHAHESKQRQPPSRSGLSTFFSQVASIFGAAASICVGIASSYPVCTLIFGNLRAFLACAISIYAALHPFLAVLYPIWAAMHPFSAATHPFLAAALTRLRLLGSAEGEGRSERAGGAHPRLRSEPPFFHSAEK